MWQRISVTTTVRWEEERLTLNRGGLVSPITGLRKKHALAAIAVRWKRTEGVLVWEGVCAASSTLRHS